MVSIKKGAIAASAFVLAAVLGYGLQHRSPLKPKEHPMAQVSQVFLLKDRIDPDTVLVGVGEFIQFNSRDGRSHNLAQGRGNNFGRDHDHEPGLESGVFGPDEAYRVQIKKPGTYFWHDHAHPELSATVVAY